MEAFNFIIWQPFFNAYKSRFEDADCVRILKRALDKLEKFFKKQMNGADWLSGTFDPMMIDIHCFAIVERCVMLKKTLWHKAYITLDVPEILFGWCHRFKKHPLFKEHTITKDAYTKYQTRANE